MPNKNNKAASSHADAAATSANEKGVFYFTFPHSKEPTAISHPLASSLSDSQKKKYAYEWLVDWVLPFYLTEKAIPLRDTYFVKFFFEEHERKKQEQEKAAVLKMWEIENKKIMFFLRYGTTQN